MGKKNEPIGALTDSGQLKHILRYKRDTRLYVAPSWDSPPHDYWVTTSRSGIIQLVLKKHTYFKENSLYQVETTDGDLYFDRLVLRGQPLRIIQAHAGYGVWHLMDGRPHFIFTNYFYAFGYMLRSNHARDALHPRI